MPSEPSVRRVGARRMADIPPDVMRAMNEGRIETITLVEMLAIDLPTLLSHALREAPVAEAGRRRVLAAARAAQELGVMARMRAVGAALHAEGGGALREALRRHPSDVVRELAVVMLEADPGVPAQARLDATLPYAADPHMGVREMAWATLRPYVLKDPETWLRLLEPWSRHEDPNVRRCAVEGTRPRGVWCAHFPLLAREPERALHLLEPSRAHPSKYLRTSVANWLNDASKSRPEWVEAVCARWSKESPGAETAWLVRHATRTLRRG